MRFGTLKSIMMMPVRRREQRQRNLKAKVALELYNKSGRVPSEHEIDEAYHVTRNLKAVLGKHFLRMHHKPTGQLALF
jgi:hypothetical protein